MSSPTKPPSLSSSSSISHSVSSTPIGPKILLQPEAPFVSEVKVSVTLVVPKSWWARRKDYNAFEEIIKDKKAPSKKIKEAVDKAEALKQAAIAAQKPQHIINAYDKRLQPLKEKLYEVEGLEWAGTCEKALADEQVSADHIVKQLEKLAELKKMGEELGEDLEVYNDIERDLNIKLYAMDAERLFTDADVEKMAKSSFKEALIVLFDRLPGLYNHYFPPPYDCYLLSQTTSDGDTIRDNIYFHKQKGDTSALTDLLKYLLFIEKIPPRVLKAMHLAWGNEFVSVKTLDLPPRDPKAKTIKLGLLGYAFNDSSVGTFTYGLIHALMRHHADKIEIVCLNSRAKSPREKSDLSVNKKRYDQFYGDCDPSKISYHYLGDKEISEIPKEIAKHNLDILIALDGLFYPEHLTSVFSKPARKIVNYLGYPHIVGAPQVDYRFVSDLSDKKADKKEDEKTHRKTEKLIYLKNSFLCFLPNKIFKFPDVELEPPCIKNGFISFGCTNNPSKITPTYLRHVKRLLETYPQSQMIFRFIQMDTALLTKLIYQAGIDVRRVKIFDGSLLKHEDHLKNLNQVDIFLDTFPYNGTTTNTDYFMMGMPVMTYEGEHHVARVTSMFHKVVTGDAKGELNLAEDLIAHNEEEYFKKIDDLVKSPDKIRAYRKHLRNQFLKSELCNEKIFADRMMEAFEKIVKDEI